MDKLTKYRGIFPAFYACYDDNGNISPERTKEFTQYLINKGVKGLYVCGSSGECVYQNVEERKLVLENVMEVAKGQITIIAHIAATCTRDSIELAKHAEQCGVDAVAAIPPIYFRLPEYAIEKYWLDMIEATNLDFIIYNIPGTTGYNLTLDLFKKMIKNKKVIGIKNSSMPTQDIQMFKAAGGEDFIIFNGPDEQYVAGRVIGADGGIGGTYAVMPELFIKMDELICKGDFATAKEIQYEINKVIYAMISCHGNLYSVAKEILRMQGIDIGGARLPLPQFIDADLTIIHKCFELINMAINKYC